MASQLGTDNLFRVDGMVAVITGGGSGIGLMMAKAFATNGAKKVYILGRRKEVLESAAESHPSIIAPIVCDVTSKESLQAAVDAVAADAGLVNLLIANSGVSGPSNKYNQEQSISELRRQMFDDMSMDDFTAALHVNVTGAFFTMLAFLELLDAGNRNAVENGGYGAPVKEGGKAPSIQSQVIVTSSISAFMRTHFSAPGYLAGKAAILQLVKQATGMLSPYGIRVNALTPGLFPSDMAAGMISNRNPEDEPYGHANFIPVQKFGGAEEMGGTVLYLASRAGSFCNGLILLIDGGRVAVCPSSY